MLMLPLLGPTALIMPMAFLMANLAVSDETLVVFRTGIQLGEITVDGGVVTTADSGVLREFGGDERADAIQVNLSSGSFFRGNR